MTTTTKKPKIKPIDLALRVNLTKRGHLGGDFDKIAGDWTVQTDFHAMGLIQNGPEAEVAQMKSENSASGCNGFDYRIGRDGAKTLAQIFAGSPRLLRAAKRVEIATGKEPKFKHSETYAALTELMAAVEGIESGALLFESLR